MAKLADYGIVVSDTPTVTIKGHQFPILLTMETMEHIADIYDDDYSKFEEDMNAMLNKSGGRISSKELSASDLKIMRALIYGMLKTGGLDETPETIFKFLGMNSTVVEVYGACMEVFAAQNFQDVDVKKSKKPQDYQTPQQKKNKEKTQTEVGTPWAFYLYVALTLLGWSEGFFLKSTPNLWLKSYIQWLTSNTEFEPPASVTMDKSPWW